MPIFSHKFSGLFLGKSRQKSRPAPLVIQDVLGAFTLSEPDKQDSYSGEIALPVGRVTVYLETDGTDWYVTQVPHLMDKKAPIPKK